MANRIGRTRGIGGSRSGGSLLGDLLDAVATETRSIRTRPAQAPQDAVLRGGGGSGGIIDQLMNAGGSGGQPRIGSVRLGVRHPDDAFTQFSRGPSNGTAEGFASNVDDVIARRMAELGLGAEDVTGEAAAPDVDTEAGAFAQRMEWSLEIPGEHYSGNTNQQILEFRQAEGRDFAEDTAELRDHVAEEIRSGLSTWDIDAASQIAKRAIREWIVRRVEEQGVDVTLEPLSPNYLAWKEAHGFDTRIGIRRNKWLPALREHGEVTVIA